MHLILYPVSRIEEKLKFLQSGTSKIEFNANEATKSQMLGLCLYAIEIEFHFGGDGIWTDPLDHHHVTDGAGVATTDTIHGIYYKQFGVKQKTLTLPQVARS